MTKKKIFIAAFALIAVLSIVLVGCADKVNGLTTEGVCDVENCDDANHAHNICGADDCAIISDHAHNGSCTFEGCAVEGEHTHCTFEGCVQDGEHVHCGVGGCGQTGEHQHNNCGTDNCTQEGKHSHGSCGSNNPGKGNSGRGCCKNR